MSSWKFGLKLLAFKGLNLLDFVHLPLVDFIELSGCFGASLLDLIPKLLGLVIMCILHILHILLVLANLRFQAPYLRLHFGLFRFPRHHIHLFPSVCLLAGSLRCPKALLQKQVFLLLISFPRLHLGDDLLIALTTKRQAYQSWLHVLECLSLTICCYSSSSILCLTSSPLISRFKSWSTRLKCHFPCCPASCGLFPCWRCTCLRSGRSRILHLNWYLI